MLLWEAESEEGLASWLEAFQTAALKRPQAVTVHIYDAVEENEQVVGTAHFHVGVEVNGCEWSYGEGSGVFSSKATHCGAHSYRHLAE